MNQKKLLSKLLLVIIILLLPFNILEAQRDYATGIGIRGISSNGLTVKHFLRDNAAVEGILSTRWRGVFVIGLYELHQNVFNTTNFNFYYGGGGHLGGWSTGRINNSPFYDNGGSYFVFGIDGIIGLEYSFDEVPFSISLDWKPMLNIVQDTRFFPLDIGLSVRYTIK